VVPPEGLESPERVPPEFCPATVSRRLGAQLPKTTNCPGGQPREAFRLTPDKGIEVETELFPVTHRSAGRWLVVSRIVLPDGTITTSGEDDLEQDPFASAETPEAVRRDRGIAGRVELALRPSW
jgi:hypothetical protein